MKFYLCSNFFNMAWPGSSSIHGISIDVYNNLHGGGVMITGKSEGDGTQSGVKVISSRAMSPSTVEPIVPSKTTLKSTGIVIEIRAVIAIGKSSSWCTLKTYYVLYRILERYIVRDGFKYGL